jgi:hypothetical protein
MTIKYTILTHTHKKNKKTKKTKRLHESRLFPTLYNAREQLNYKLTSQPAATLYQVTTFTNASENTQLQNKWPINQVSWGASNLVGVSMPIIQQRPDIKIISKTRP